MPPVYKIRKTILAPAMVLAIFLTDMAPTMADSDPACPANTRAAHVQGTMKTNAVAPGETLGVAQLVVQGAGMLRCGLHGLATGPTGFTHTLVCDDNAAVANSTDTVHSQLITSSQFVPPTAFQACATPAGAIQGSFNEISDPFFGRGAFSSAGGGRIYAQGSINCAGAVDITLSGTVCLAK